MGFVLKLLVSVARMTGSIYAIQGLGHVRVQQVMAAIAIKCCMPHGSIELPNAASNTVHTECTRVSNWCR